MNTRSDLKRAKKAAQKTARQVLAPKPRGLAALTPERRKEIAAMGGRSVHAKGTGHRFTSKSASKAGKKGGTVVSKNRKHMARIGAKGGMQ